MFWRIGLGIVLGWCVAGSLAIAQPVKPTTTEEPNGSNVNPAEIPTPESSASPTTPQPRINPPAPPVIPPRTAPVSLTNQSSRTSTFAPRLVNAPYVMGDSLSPSLGITDTFVSTFDEGTMIQIPSGGGSASVKIADNNRALPSDRIFVNYNHFHNALQTELDSISGQVQLQNHLDRFTLGFEKTCFDEWCSAELRLPLLAGNDFLGPGFAQSGGALGNLGVTLKCLLASDEYFAMVAGLSCGLPTADETSVVYDTGFEILTFINHNEAVHLGPYLGMMCAGRSGLVHQFFVQVDVATSSNRLDFFEDSNPPSSLNVNDQTLMFIDYSLAAPFYQAGHRSSSRIAVRRMSLLTEFHYTTTLQDADFSEIDTGSNSFNVGAVNNRIDVVNMTLGVQADLAGGSIVRVGGVVPLTERTDRFFDAEVQAQVIKPF